MNTQEMLKELNYTLNQEKNKTYDTCSTNWRSLLEDIIVKIKELESDKTTLMQGVKNAQDELNECLEEKFEIKEDAALVKALKCAFLHSMDLRNLNTLIYGTQELLEWHKQIEKEKFDMTTVKIIGCKKCPHSYIGSYGILKEKNLIEVKGRVGLKGSISTTAHEDDYEIVE